MTDNASKALASTAGICSNLYQHLLLHSSSLKDNPTDSHASQRKTSVQYNNDTNAERSTLPRRKKPGILKKLSLKEPRKEKKKLGQFSPSHLHQTNLSERQIGSGINITLRGRRVTTYLPPAMPKKRPPVPQISIPIEENFVSKHEGASSDPPTSPTLMPSSDTGIPIDVERILKIYLPNRASLARVYVAPFF